MSINYPIKFIPILHERIWGGEKLHTILGKEARDEAIGESWEVSTVPGSVSVVANGSLKSQNLQDLINTYKADFVGDKVFEKYATNFPLLIKFIDAKTDLSVQLHPNDELAMKRHNSFGKEEMWYIMQAEKEAKLMFGFNQKLTREDYKTHLKNNTLSSVLQYEEVKNDEVYYIPTGRVHAIGGGVMLAEIQQSSDVTYRLYDWDRKDKGGKGRELHTELALDAIDFEVPKSFKTDYTFQQNVISPIIDSPYFITEILVLDELGKKIKREYQDSFTIYICVAGEVTFITENDLVNIKKGETIFIPAVLDDYSLFSKIGHAKLLVVGGK